MYEFYYVLFSMNHLNRDYDFSRSQSEFSTFVIYIFVYQIFRKVSVLSTVYTEIYGNHIYQSFGYFLF